MARICWIEDAEEHVEDMRAHLAGVLKHQVHVMRNCDQVVALMTKPVLPYDLFIVDLWLPYENKSVIPIQLREDPTRRGLWLVGQLHEAIRRLKLAIPIIVLSGNLDLDTKEFVNQKLDSRLTRLLDKPADFDSTLQLIDEMLKVDH